MIDHDPNLNDISPDDVDGNYARSSRTVARGLDVHFDDLEIRLIQQIERHDVILGCVAWLTNERILRALAGKQVAIVVQKEDFLRPDSGRRSRSLRQLYDALQSPERFQLPGTAGNLSTCADSSFQAVRCVGNHNSDRRPAFPRMHHKFCVFGMRRPRSDVEEYERFSFDSVWTGSFNWTHNATKSLENALVIREPAVVDGYLDEFGHVFALSEPLDWTSPWCEPEWRIGT